ncbi:hypothetical protein M5K25_007639 [Dendrobium thyrsiflorum]|uniref:Uncharacterized protein n=1 Tax=Dendrobium thyrsiflorum TaxID=117978 RepID=A0ABD0VM21_DENTH
MKSPGDKEEKRKLRLRHNLDGRMGPTMMIEERGVITSGIRALVKAVLRKKEGYCSQEREEVFKLPVTRRLRQHLDLRKDC